MRYEALMLPMLTRPLALMSSLPAVDQPCFFSSFLSLRQHRDGGFRVLFIWRVVQSSVKGDAAFLMSLPTLPSGWEFKKQCPVV